MIQNTSPVKSKKHRKEILLIYLFFADCDLQTSEHTHHDLSEDKYDDVGRLAA